MDQTNSTAEAALATTLGQLYAALADADPLVAPAAPVADGAHALAAAYGAADDEGRARLLLRALDEAIAALEVAATLAEAHDKTHAQPGAATGADTEEDPLATAYLAYAASQPSYQALYHFRNALAARLRLEARPLPPAVAAPDSAEEPPQPEH